MFKGKKIFYMALKIWKAGYRRRDLRSGQEGFVQDLYLLQQLVYKTPAKQP